MATATERTEAIIAAMADDDSLTPKQIKDIVEEFTGLFGKGASPATMNEEFIRQLGIIMSARMGHQGESRKRNEVAQSIVDEGVGSKNKLPPGWGK